jgi:hypothetical protein
MIRKLDIESMLDNNKPILAAFYAALNAEYYMQHLALIILHIYLYSRL